MFQPCVSFCFVEIPFILSSSFVTRDVIVIGVEDVIAVF